MNLAPAIILAGITFIGNSLGARAEEMMSTTNQPARKQVELLRSKAAEFYSRSDYARALESMKQALKAAEAAWGDSNTNVTELLDLTAGIYRTQGNYSNALAFCKRSLVIREKGLGLEHPDVANSLFAMASLYNDLGDYAEGLQMGSRSLEIREKTFGSEHQDVAASLGILSKIFVNQGDYPRALEALGRAFNYWDKHFETNPYLAVTCLNDMASINQDLGNYDSSLRLYQAASALYEKLYGPDCPSLAACWNNIASIYEKQRSFADALAFYRRSLSLKVKILGSEHPDVALSFNNSAKALAQLGKHAEAMKLYQRALSILEKALGDTHPSLAIVLNNIAELYKLQSEPSNALPLFERSLQITENARGKEHPLVASVLNNLASVYESQGRIPKALSLYGRSLAITERALGHHHPEVISILRNIAALCLEQEDTRGAVQAYADAFRRRREYFQLQFSEATDKEAMRTIERDRFSEEIFHSLCGTSALLGAEELALNKGTLEEVRVTQAALESDPETATRRLREQRQAVLNRLERLAESQLDPEQQVETRLQIEAKVKAIDGELSERSPLAVLSLRDRTVTISGIARSLPPKSVLVDLVHFWRFDSGAKTNWWKEQRYAAYLTFPLANSSTNVIIERVDLGEAVPINEAVELICKRMSTGQFAAKDLAPALQRLSNLVYFPLARHLTNVSHLFICPDGQLSRLSFEMLPVGNRFLVEEKNLSYVTSGREIVRLAVNQSASKPQAQTTKPLVLGNPDFNFDLSRSGRGNEALTSSLQHTTKNPQPEDHSLLILSRDYRGLQFKPLPGAEAEASRVAKLLGSECVLRLGTEAREADLKAVVSPRVLHLATHGFFLSDQEFKDTNSLSADPWQQDFPSRMENNWENPMVRCGIALAGANHARQITNAVAEDGLLTGLEASLLNLQGTELVILSACDSGAGEVKIGEGVMSLRRAFRIAGAETVLASHWKVNDKATSRLMTEFIRRWRSGEPRAQAWREAQLSLLHSKDFSNPYFWAAFTLTGQWR